MFLFVVSLEKSLTFKKKKKKRVVLMFFYVRTGPFSLVLRWTRAQYCTVPQSKRSSWRKYEIVLMWSFIVHLFVGGKPFKGKCCVQFERLFACRAVVKMSKADVRSDEASGHLGLKTCLNNKDSTFYNLGKSSLRFFSVSLLSTGCQNEPGPAR